MDCDTFQDAHAFLINGGQRGPQAMVIPEGSFRINSLLFSVTKVPLTVINKNQIGIVEAHGGTPIPVGRVLAKHVSCNRS